MSYSWLEEVEAYIGHKIAMHVLDDATAWEEIKDMAEANIESLEQKEETDGD